jgi:hypothetical protein
VTVATRYIKIAAQVVETLNASHAQGNDSGRQAPMLCRHCSSSTPKAHRGSSCQNPAHPVPMLQVVPPRVQCKPPPDQAPRLGVLRQVGGHMVSPRPGVGPNAIMTRADGPFLPPLKPDWPLHCPSQLRHPSTSISLLLPCRPGSALAPVPPRRLHNQGDAIWSG